MAFKTKAQREAEAATETAAPPVATETVAPTRVAKRTDILRLEKAAKKFAPAENRKPADPIEHFRKVACEYGHMNWHPTKTVYSIDHRSFLIYCVDCDEYSVIPAGSPIPLSVPGGLVPGTNG